jgi:hypothetical protein
MARIRNEDLREREVKRPDKPANNLAERGGFEPPVEVLAPTTV